MKHWWRHSAVDVDALSWLTSSLATVGVPVMVALYGILAITAGGQSGDEPLVQVLALVIMVAAGVLVHVASRPHRGPISTTMSVLVFVCAGLAVVVSAGGLRGSDVVAEQWWAPIGAALISMSVSPFVAGRLFLPGAAALAAGTFAAALWATSGTSSEVVLSPALIGASPVVFAVIGGSLLAGVMVADVQRWRSMISDVRLDGVRTEPVLAILERVTGGAWSQRMQPFLESIVDARAVTDRDRRQAAALADELRTALVDRSDQSWLTELVSEWPVYVDDPHQLAETITVDQRSAITALIAGVFSDPVAGVFGARVRLAAGSDDSVAVAVTISLDLPEGRRTTVLAPYYLSVKSVVKRIGWRNGESLEVSFDLDAGATR